MALPVIPKLTVKAIDNIIRNFLWNGGKAKIAYKTLQNPKDQGGLNLINLTNRDRALKATWPQILSKEEQYAQLVYNILRCSSLNDHIWRCRLHPTDVDKLNISNQFWVDVLKCWGEYNFYSNFRIENQYIWYNSNIQIQNKPFFWKDVFERGLIYVHQLYENKTLKSDQQVLQEFGLKKLRYNSLKTAIPKEWKDFFTQNTSQQYTPIPPHNYDIAIISEENLSRKIYKFLAEDVMLIHNKYLQWMQDLGPYFCESLCEFGKAHMYIHKTTNITKYRSFQYRLLQRGLVTNIQLAKWHIKDNNMCSFCNSKKETLMHLFIECTETAALWTQVIAYINQRYSNKILTTEPENIILNTIVPEKYHAINFLCLLTKQYIYRQKCQGKNLCINQLILHFTSTERLEKYVAIKNSKLVTHNKKWQSNLPGINNNPL